VLPAGQRYLLTAVGAVLDPGLLPAGCEAADVADGCSCRTQIRQATDGAPVHLAHLAAAVVVRPGPASGGSASSVSGFHRTEGGPGIANEFEDCWRVAAVESGRAYVVGADPVEAVGQDGGRERRLSGLVERDDAKQR
jgi:hypothetical protein